ncbi:MAG: hypothetical protein ACK4TR_08840 [Phenylobacterium sp.]|uniref:hypothetical protein n=1 Tax=Phenylobacterium sp. TaxID=1871053 RepID=UPI00391C387D
MLGAISGKLDIILLNQEEEKRRNDIRFSKIEDRQDAADDEIASLKRDRSWVLGAAAAVSTVAAAFASWAGNLIR